MSDADHKHPDDKLALLKQLPGFAQLEDAQLNDLLSAMEPLHLADGQTLFRQGEKTPYFYVVARGKLGVFKAVRLPRRASVASPDSESEQKAGSFRVALLERGEFTGFGNLFENVPHSATVTSSGESDVYQISNERFLKLLQSDNTIAISLLRYLNRELSQYRHDYHRIKSGSSSDAISICFFDSKRYARKFFSDIDHQRYPFNFHFVESRLSEETVHLAEGFQIICIFVNDSVSETTARVLHNMGVQMIALRCAGFDNVNLRACDELGITVARVPVYSPYAVAEHAVALMLTLNRKIHLAYDRVKHGNFSLEGLVGFDMHDKTVGVIGTGAIGECLINIVSGMGCRVLCYDIYQKDSIKQKPNCQYVELDQVIRESDILSLHTPLTDKTYHMINPETLSRMKRGVMIINTSRGGLINTAALLDALKSGQVGTAGLDVYEQERAYFFEDRSGDVMGDDMLARLLSLNNVIITGHQAFLTEEALNNIVSVTLKNIDEFVRGKRTHELTNSLNKKP